MKKNITLVISLIVSLLLFTKYDTETFIIPASALLPDGGKYYGQIREGQFTGEGKIIWANGRSYHGMFDNGLFSGQGKLLTAKGDLYEGQFVEGILTGQGYLKTTAGIEYKGQFKNFHFDGFGQKESKRGSSYIGHFKNDQFHGSGTLTIKDDESYVGNFENGKYQGEGHLIYSNGSSYRGYFKMGEFHGPGLYKTNLGDRYEGEFVESQFTGTGVFEDAHDNHYKGEFKDWLYQGQGKFSNNNGDQFEGEFEQGQLTGEGVYYAKEGQTYHGQFLDWKYHGRGELLNANGDRYQGEFKYGYYNGPGILNYAVANDGVTQLSGKWRYGNYIGDGIEPEPREANTEKVLYNQNQLIQATINRLLPSDSKQINLFFVGIGGDGKQDVFLKEVTTIRKIFDQSYNTKGHSVIVANNPKTVDSTPLATRTGIEQILLGVSSKMDQKKDILFIYLTSHGSKKHELVLDQDGLAIADLPAKRLARIVNDLPVKWKIIVISACYSGGFIPELKNKHSLIMTSAAHDRTSFGCSDDADMTYFGRAFFLDALPVSKSFEAAFEKAKELVLIREMEIIADDKSQHSKPEISNPKAISNYLKQWRAQHERLQSVTEAKKIVPTKFEFMVDEGH